VLSFARINCDPVFSNGYFEAKIEFGLAITSDSGKTKRECCGMVKTAGGGKGIKVELRIEYFCVFKREGILLMMYRRKQ
jgi:hypothetical protein